MEEDDSLTLVLNGGVEVRLGRQDFAQRLAKLEFMTRELEDFDSLDYIDLRFEDQIVYRPRNG